MIIKGKLNGKCKGINTIFSSLYTHVISTVVMR